MSRWKVYKDRKDRRLRWIAVPAHENWRKKPRGLRLPCWDMAMDYATKMARTERPEDYTRTTSPEQLAKALTELGYKQEGQS